MLFDKDTQFNTVRRQTILVAHRLLEPLQGNQVEYSPPYILIPEQKHSQSTPSNQQEWILEFPKNQLDPEPSISDVETPKNEGRVINSPEIIAPGNGNDMLVNQLSPEILERETVRKETNMVSSFSEHADQTDYHDVIELEDQLLGEPLGTDPSFAHQPEQPASGYESVSALAGRSSAYYITYSCLLIPRMPEHLLTSNLASYLFKWMGQLCLAYGWRLEHLSIHPDHIQMITEAPLTTSPAYLIRTLRQKTSQYIFAQFPPLTSENPSGDFWAPGFFVTGGKHTIQPQLIEHYIDEIREHQGVKTLTS